MATLSKAPMARPTGTRVKQARPAGAPGTGAPTMKKTAAGAAAGALGGALGSTLGRARGMKKGGVVKKK